MIAGHRPQIEAFLAAMQGKRPPHGWIFAGPKGLGKASLAQLLATRLLAEAAGPPPASPPPGVEAAHPVAAMMAAGSHPDFVLLERLPAEDKFAARPRAEWPDDVQLKRSIGVDQVRAMIGKTATFPSISAKRVILVDSADDLERPGANAMLKLLEEPPAGTIFLLVSHAPGRLLPTIRSRCRMLNFAPLDEAEMAAALGDALPAMPEAERLALARLAVGAPGRAVALARLDVPGLEAALEKIAQSGDAGNTERMRLARALSGKPAQQRYEAFLERAPAFIARRAKGLSGDAFANAIRQWESARDLAQAAVPLSLDPKQVVFALAGHVAALADRESRAKA